ncbi:MAG: hypothetical protein JWQ69_511 [Pseudomonas sp.]|nr:hypothetical protein [Pseudomonas sp.]
MAEMLKVRSSSCKVGAVLLRVTQGRRDRRFPKVDSLNIAGC